MARVFGVSRSRKAAVFFNIVLKKELKNMCESEAFAHLPKAKEGYKGIALCRADVYLIY